MRAMQSNGFSMNKTWNVRGRLVDVSSPLIMGVINLTPDSFYAGSRLSSTADVLRAVEQMIKEGADIIDMGGYSSRPGATDITVEEEIQRTLPVVQATVREFSNILISIDTFRSKVAERVLDAGAHLVNDISAGELDPALPSLAASAGVPYVAMHMKGTPQTMNTLTHYDDLVHDIIAYFHKKLAWLTHLGLKDIVIDPGFGFAKTVDQNFVLLHNLSALKVLGRPILAGVSRKSMIWRTLETTPEESLNGTTALNMAALINGASILRVHDVKAARECVTLWSRMNA
jgi:dihydropteroate synthase